MPFEIPDDLLDLWDEGIEAIMNSGIARQCILVYPPTITECPNCLLDVFQDKSTNIYKAGGPIQFDSGICPLCHGDGHQNVEVVENITMLIYEDVTKFKDFGFTFDIPSGSIMTRARIYDIPKIERAAKLIVDITLNGIHTYIFSPLSESRPYGFRKKYCMRLWKRLAN